MTNTNRNAPIQRVPARAGRPVPAGACRHGRRAVLRLTPIAALLLQLGSAAQPALAGPQGGVVRAGSAQIVQTNAVRLDVNQTTPRAVIDWTGFSIGAGERVQFNQPSRDSATLNRVTGAQASAIEGQLVANGNVFLVNPNGIVFGAGARVDVGGLVATTANVADDRFMAGELRFDLASPNPNARVINRGRIDIQQGGLAALVAPGVENSGTIVARLGKIALASGRTFTLDLAGDQLISFAAGAEVLERMVDENGAPVAALVRQTDAGGMFADGGQVVMLSAGAAKEVVDQAINLQGVVVAQTAEQRGGEIVLAGRGGAVEIAGSLYATGTEEGTRGGRIEVGGDSVHLASASTLDASGLAGGGAVSIGERRGEPLPASVRIDGRVHADALASGSGGTIAVRSVDALDHQGTLAARALGAAGDGGEISLRSGGTLGFAGEIGLSAAAGRGGALNLGAGSLALGTAEATRLSQALQQGARTAVATTGGLSVNARIDGRGGPAAGATLTLEAGGDLRLNQDVYTANGGFRATSTGGTLAMSGAAIDLGGGATRSGALIGTGTAPVTLRGQGDVTLQHVQTGGALTVTSDQGAVRFAADLAGANVGGLLAPRLGRVTVRAPNASEGVVTLGVLDARGIDVRAGRRIVTNGRLHSEDSGIALGAVPGQAAPEIVLREGLFTANQPIRLEGTVRLQPAGDVANTVGADSTRQITLKTNFGGTGADIDLLGTVDASSAAPLGQPRDVALHLNAGSAGAVFFGGDVIAVPAGRFGRSLQLSIGSAAGVGRAAGANIRPNRLWIGGNPADPAAFPGPGAVTDATMESLLPGADFNLGAVQVQGFGGAIALAPAFEPGPSSIPPGPTSSGSALADASALPSEILPPGTAPQAADPGPLVEPTPPAQPQTGGGSAPGGGTPNGGTTGSGPTDPGTGGTSGGAGTGGTADGATGGTSGGAAAGGTTGGGATSAGGPVGDPGSTGSAAGSGSGTASTSTAGGSGAGSTSPGGAAAGGTTAGGSSAGGAAGSSATGSGSPVGDPGSTGSAAGSGSGTASTSTAGGSGAGSTSQGGAAAGGTTAGGSSAGAGSGTGTSAGSGQSGGTASASSSPTTQTAEAGSGTGAGADSADAANPSASADSGGRELARNERREHQGEPVAPAEDEASEEERAADAPVVVFAGGRGVAQYADLGRTTAAEGAAAEVFAGEAQGQDRGARVSTQKR